MKNCIGIRHENKDLTERRAPLTPQQVKKVVEELGIRVVVQPAENRVFSAEEYRRAGALISSDLSECNIIFGIKEVPKGDLQPDQTLCYFSHTIKGQPYNMPMLQKIIDLKITLLDYEMVTNEAGKRQIYFGNYAGYAGMIDTLWALGQRLKEQGIDTPFTSVQPAHHYQSLQAAKEAIREVGGRLGKEGLPAEITPLVCGFTGYGNVSKGAQEIYDLLPVQSIAPSELQSFSQQTGHSRHLVYKVEFHESDMFELKTSAPATREFDLQDYFSHPEKYRSKFSRYVPHLSMIINAIYWTEACPRLVTKAYLKELFAQESAPRLRVVGDISCDIEGSMEMTVKATNSRNPVYVYSPQDGQIADGFSGKGVVVMAVDKLPTELPREASQFFGNELLPYLPNLAALDFGLPFDKLPISADFRKAIIVHQGELTPAFRYLNQYLKGSRL